MKGENKKEEECRDYYGIAMEETGSSTLIVLLPDILLKLYNILSRWSFLTIYYFKADTLPF